ncbi:ComEA family DNA-binding protein [Yersinia intermedia]|nr:ComEA family DNA-binding protein [Yersinia intermedia]
MKFIGKLFVITALFAGLPIQQIAFAAPGSPTSHTQDKTSNSRSHTPINSQVKAGSPPAKVAEKNQGQVSTAATTAAGTPTDSASQININSATAEQLAQFLSGIGRKKAEAIVSYREQFGPFTDTEQLLEVPGIGPSFLERNNTKLKM